jgi:uncharacterized protein YutE (UPF0331/DUF86 family)
MKDNHIISKFGGKTPILFTNSYNVFSIELTENLFLLYYILVLDSYIDEDNKQEALDDLIKHLYDPKNIVSSKLVNVLKNDIKTNLFDANSYERIFGQMTLCRYVDNFLCYLKDVLVEVVNKQPNILKSSETEKLEDILSFESIEELREFIIEKKLKTLFYKNIDDINKFFTDKLGMDILGDSKDELNLLIKQRNVIVHNRAKINDELLALVPQYENHFGEQLIFKYDKLEHILLFLNNLAVDIDTKLIDKFKLEKIKNQFV